MQSFHCGHPSQQKTFANKHIKHHGAARYSVKYTMQFYANRQGSHSTKNQSQPLKQDSRAQTQNSPSYRRLLTEKRSLAELIQMETVSRTKPLGMSTFRGEEEKTAKLITNCSLEGENRAEAKGRAYYKKVDHHQQTMQFVA